MRRVIRSPRGVVGIVPLAAVDRKTGLLTIEVDVVLVDKRRISVYVPTRLEEIEERLREQDGNIASIRTWISNRAQTRLILTNPSTADQIVNADAIYWLCGNRREPFIR